MYKHIPLLAACLGTAVDILYFSCNKTQNKGVDFQHFISQAAGGAGAGRGWGGERECGGVASIVTFVSYIHSKAVLRKRLL